MELRITTGIAKNKRLAGPNIPDFRAVQEIAKSSLFSIIGEEVLDTVCLDLFAGSGNLGLEALSRGAAWCDFVDENKESVETIKQNIEKCGFFDKSSVTLKSAVKYVSATDKKYDFVFMDPFYNDLNHKHLLGKLRSRMKENGKLFYFFSTENKESAEILLTEAGFKILDSRHFGNSVFAVASTTLDQSENL